jgi:hypothetical protein
MGQGSGSMKNHRGKGEITSPHIHADWEKICVGLCELVVWFKISAGFNFMSCFPATKWLKKTGWASQFVTLED